MTKERDDKGPDLNHDEEKDEQVQIYLMRTSLLFSKVLLYVIYNFLWFIGVPNTDAASCHLEIRTNH